MNPIHQSRGSFSFEEASTWILPCAKRAPAPGWHSPQVATRLSLWIREAGSEEERMSCDPWQLAQFATLTWPPLTARPWKLSSNVLNASLLMSYFSESWREEWQGVQTFWETFAAETGESGSSAFRMPCSPWQVVQVGASRTPLASAFPWALFAKTLSISVWQRPQIFSMSSGVGPVPDAVFLRTVWAPWQSTQFAACSFPARRARPWTLFSYWAMKPALGATRRRSEERRVGKECCALCRSRWSPYH